MPKGTLVIRAAELIGIQVPRFCDHPLLDPVGACRQCLVEVEGQRKPLASCTIDGHRRHGRQDPAHLAGRRQGAAGHHGDAAHQPPARLPGLRQGRRVPAAEPGDEQRPRRVAVQRRQAHLPEADHHLHARCCSTASAACCARAAPGSPQQIAGDPFIELFERGALQQVGIYEAEPFESYFSGNTVQICPVGALTGAAYRFRSRPVRPRLLARRLRALRVRLRDPHRPPPRQGAAPAGRRRPRGQRGVELRQGPLGLPVRHRAGPAHHAAGPRRGRRRSCRRPGPRRWTSRPAGWPRREGATGVLVGGRATVEDAYAYAKFARVALGTNDIDFRARPHSAEEARFLAAHVAGTRARRHLRRPRARPVGAARRARARGRVADRLPAAAQGRRASGLTVHAVAPFATPRPRQAARARCSRRRRAPRPRSSTRLPHAGRAGRRGRGRRGARQPGRIDPRRRAAGRRARRAVRGRRAGRGDRRPPRLGAAPGRRARRARGRRAARACCPVAARSPTPPPASTSRPPGASTRCPHEPGRDTAGILAAVHAGEVRALLVGGVDPDDLPDPLAAARGARRGRVRRQPRAARRRRSPSAPTSCCRSRRWSRRPAPSSTGRAATRPFDAVLRGTNAMPDVRVLHVLADGDGRRPRRCPTCRRRAPRSPSSAPWDGDRADAPSRRRRRRRVPPGDGRGRARHLAAAARRRPAAGRRAVPRRHRPAGGRPALRGTAAGDRCRRRRRCVDGQHRPRRGHGARCS